jgi:hypothetical protein
VTDPELDFETHLQRYRAMWGGQAQGAQARAERDAQYQHALYVFNALRNFACEITSPLAEQLHAENAIYYMGHGAGRRLLMIWRSYRSIVWTTPPRRDKIHFLMTKKLPSVATSTLFICTYGVFWITLLGVFLREGARYSE